MNPKIPSYFLVAAMAVMGVSTGAKESPEFRDILGRSEIYEWGCATTSSICVAIAVLLAMYGLAAQPTKRLYYFGIHFWAIALLCSVVGLQFFIYVVFTKIYYQLDSKPNALPKLVENARTGGSEDKRQKMAQNAYKVYGVTIAYRRDNGELAYYEPTQADLAFQKDFTQTATHNHELNEEIIGGQLKQLPLVIALEIGSFLLTLLLGCFLVAWKKNQLEPGSQA